MKLKSIGIISAAGLILASSVMAASGLSVAVQAGTMGIGLDVAKAFSPKWAARIGGNFFSYSIDSENDEYGIKYSGDLKLQSFSILADYFLGGGFYLSGGAFINNNKIEASGMSSIPREYDNSTYTPEELGDFSVAVDFSKFAPYLGLGFRSAGTIGFAMNLGALYMNSPKVAMQATGMIEPTAEQAPQVEEDLKGLKLYPVFSLGLVIGF
ncbi:hypothetical protein JW906_14500 [bacterium]|nr:hypothetical protein [bacterium]